MSAEPNPASGRPRVVIIGVGNLLLGDEGVGIHVVEVLKPLGLPAQVIDGGTAGLGLIDHIAEAEHLILIDAARMGRRPGDVVLLRPAEVAQAVEQVEEEASLSAHQQGLLAVLKLAFALGYRPQVTIIAIEPKSVDWGTALSDEVQLAVARVLEMVRREVAGADPSIG